LIGWGRSRGRLTFEDPVPAGEWRGDLEAVVKPSAQGRGVEEPETQEDGGHGGG